MKKKIWITSAVLTVGILGVLMASPWNLNQSWAENYQDVEQNISNQPSLVQTVSLKESDQHKHSHLPMNDKKSMMTGDQMSSTMMDSMMTGDNKVNHDMKMNSTEMMKQCQQNVDKKQSETNA